MFANESNWSNEKIWINNWIKVDRSSSNYVVDKSGHAFVVEKNVCSNEMYFITLMNRWESKLDFGCMMLYLKFCVDCEK